MTSSAATNSSNATKARPCISKPARVAKWIGITVTLVSFVFIVRQLPVAEAIGAMRGFINNLGALGPIVFALIYVVAALLLIPGSVLTIAAGGLFGLGLGMIVVSLASTAAAALALLIARYLARHRVERWAQNSKKFRAMDHAIRAGGWRIVAMLRLSPAIPFSLQNYFYGLTSIRFMPCVFTSWLAMLPGTFLYVYVGYLGAESIGAAVGENASLSVGRWLLLGCGLVATVAATVYITQLSRKQLKKQTEVESENSEKQDDSKTPASNDGTPCKRWTKGATFALIAAVLAVVTACTAPQIRRAITAMFGPPKVFLAEVYERQKDGPEFEHSTLDAVLKKHVDADGWVDYELLKSNPDKLDAYIQQLASADFDTLGRDEKLALLINAYNAFTLKLIIEHYPLASIRDIPSAERWDAVRWQIGKLKLSLSQIENDYLRPKFIEPRIHFAINCASIGCPKLAQSAYTGPDIEQQLTTAAQIAHQPDSRWFRFDEEANRVQLSKIYDWYRNDFEQTADSLLKYVAQYSPAVKAAIDEGNPPAITFLDYDWSLNAQPRP